MKKNILIFGGGATIAVAILWYMYNKKVTAVSAPVGASANSVATTGTGSPDNNINTASTSVPATTTNNTTTAQSTAAPASTVANVATTVPGGDTDIIPAVANVAVTVTPSPPSATVIKTVPLETVTFSANKGFSATANWVDIYGVPQQKFINQGDTLTVNALSNTANGLPVVSRQPLILSANGNGCEINNLQSFYQANGQAQFIVERPIVSTQLVNSIYKKPVFSNDFTPITTNN